MHKKFTKFHLRQLKSARCIMTPTYDCLCKRTWSAVKILIQNGMFCKDTYLYSTLIITRIRLIYKMPKYLYEEIT